jgi:hypothetical protein
MVRRAQCMSPDTASGNLKTLIPVITFYKVCTGCQQQKECVTHHIKWYDQLR